MLIPLNLFLVLFDIFVLYLELLVQFVNFRLGHFELLLHLGHLLVDSFHVGGISILKLAHHSTVLHGKPVIVIFQSLILFMNQVQVLLHVGHLRALVFSFLRLFLFILNLNLVLLLMEFHSFDFLFEFIVFLRQHLVLLHQL